MVHFFGSRYSTLHGRRRTGGRVSNRGASGNRDGHDEQDLDGGARNGPHPNVHGQAGEEGSSCQVKFNVLLALAEGCNNQCGQI